MLHILRLRHLAHGCAFVCAAAVPCALLAQAIPAAPATAPAVGPRGYLVGQVVDKASARPLPATNVLVIGTTLRTQTDLDGRFRLPVPAGVYSVRAFRLGNVAAQQDGVTITAGVTTTVTFALGGAVVQLQAQTVTAAPTKANSEDALLAMQRAASRVSDGISAEAIKRAPGTNAGDAVVRITGVSIVDSKFAVVRGLAERYSNTLLNGVELPSPEPQKKIVPLDIFPSSLLESIVVSKTATPDKPGDFAGGSVEVTTKEFPNTRVVDFSVTTGYNSVSTFKAFSLAPQRGIDYLGFDAGGRRQAPRTIPTGNASEAAVEAFDETLRNVWTPSPTPVMPNFGATMNFGGRLGGDNAPFGYVLSANLNHVTEANPNRFFQIVLDQSGLAETSATVSEATTTTDLGGIANVAVRLGGANKIGWKNLYTRNSEELVSRNVTYSPLDGIGESSALYQVRYVTRTLLQSQLSGDHLFSHLLDSRLEWKLTAAEAHRDEPENRGLYYRKAATDSAYSLSTSKSSSYWFRYLRDRVLNAQLDWSTPIARILGDGALVKFGGMVKRRTRVFEATQFRSEVPLSAQGAAWLSLPPEKVFTPELLGPGLLMIEPTGAGALPYEAYDNLAAFYAMIDVPVRPWLRVIGGARQENWALEIYNPRKDTIATTIARRNNDVLPSVNVTLKLSDRQNLRMAAYATVARPDPRELSKDTYASVAGDCLTIGNPVLTRTTIRNADIRWERYPRPGELVAVSAFVKRFRDPIVELLGTDDGKCVVRPNNATSAELRGAEIELRRGLTMLPGWLKQLSAGLNMSFVKSSATIPIVVSNTVEGSSRTLKLQGQSDQLANASLLYATTDGRFELSVLGNYFSDRLSRYGDVVNAGTKAIPLPDTFERARFQLDAKLRRRLGRANVSLSARNLTDNERTFVQDSPKGKLVVGYLRPGVGVTLGVGYALR